MRAHPDPMSRPAARAVCLALLALLCAPGAFAQGAIVEQLRTGIEGVARGMDSLGKATDQLIGSSLGLGGPTPSSHTRTRTLEERHPTGPSPVVALSSAFGEIRVDTWNERIVQVAAEITVGADTPETAERVLAAIAVQTQPGEDVVQVKTALPETRGEKGRVVITVNYRVTVPRQASVVLDNFFGDVRMDGVGGRAAVEAQYGAVDIRRAGGVVRVRAQGEFPVIAEDLAQGGVFQLEGSRAELRRVSGELQASVFRGSLRLSEPGAALDATLTVDGGTAEIELDPAVPPDLTATILHGALTSDLELTRAGEQDRLVARHPAPESPHRISLNASFSDVGIGLRGRVPAEAPAPGGGNLFNETVTREVTPAPDAALVIEAANGNVRVEGHDGPGIAVTATRIVWMGAAAAAAVDALAALQLQVQEEPGRVAVHTLADPDMARFGCTDWRVDLTVKAPRGTPLRVNAAAGLTEVAGMAAEVRVTQAQGGVAVEGLTGNAVLSNQKGPVRLAGCAGGAEVSARFGDVTVARCGGAVSVQSVEGGIVVDTPLGPVTARSAGGAIRLISLEPLAGDMDLKADPGAVSALVAPESSAEFTLRAEGGRVQSTVPLTGSLAGDRQEFTGKLGEGKYRVLMEARGGDVALN